MKWAALLLAAGCAGATGDVVDIVRDSRDLPEGGAAPRIEAVVELGGGDVVLTAPLRAAPGDGLATVGEALWIRGSNFGRQPTVTIGGRPAAVLARTADGGLVARVPAWVPVGEQPLTVASGGGQGAHPLTVRRLLAVLPPGGGRLAVVELAGDGPRAAGEVPAVGQEVRASADGRAAYVLDETSARLTVIELPAAAGPRAGAVLELAAGRKNAPVVAFAVASAAPTLMVLRESDLLLLDTTAPLRPARGHPRTLPQAVQTGKPVRAALSPDGTMAAVLLAEGNRLVLLDLRGGGAAPGGSNPLAIVGELALAPEARVPVVADLAFVQDGRTIWVALGDTVYSRAVGPQATELLAVRLRTTVGSGNAGRPADHQPAASQPLLTVARRVSLPEAHAPARLNSGSASPLASGASIRLPPERTTVFLTAADSAGVPTVFRVGPEDRATTAVVATGSVGAAHLGPDGRWLIVPVLADAGAPGQGDSSVLRRLELLAVPADDRPGRRQVLDLGAVSPGGGGRTSAAAARLPSLACQP